MKTPRTPKQASRRERGLSRRLFLTGLGGVTLGLPFLESLPIAGRRKKARAQTTPGGSPKRLAVFFMCNGVNMDTFWPSVGYGAISPGDFAGSAMEPIAGYADRLLIPRGIHMTPRASWPPGNPYGSAVGDDHGKGMGQKLTCQPLVPGSEYAAGISVDQEIAKHLNPPNREALTLMVGSRGGGGATSYISFTGPEQPVSGRNNPWLAYQDFIGMTGGSIGGGGDPGGEVQDLLVNRRKSVIDLVAGQLEKLTSPSVGLSKGDQDKLDMHLSIVRDLEQELAASGMPQLASCELPADRVAEIEALDPDQITWDSQFKTIGRMHMDILALSLACDTTRAASIQWGTGAGGPVFTWDGMSHAYNHHKLSHGETMDDGGQPVPGYQGMLFDIDTWFMNELEYLLDRLDGYAEADGTVLDNSCVLFTNELSDGKGHDYRDQPYIIAGSCGGYFETGRYVKMNSGDNTMATDAPNNKLMTTILNAVGVTAPGGGPVQNFGHPDYTPESGEYDVLKA